MRPSGSVPDTSIYAILASVMKIASLLMAAAFLLGSTVSLSAQYVLVLKNGRQITVPSYREEGSMVKFQGFGGEIGLSKDQIQAIRKMGVGEAAGLNVIKPEGQQPARSQELEPQPAPEQAPSEAEERARIESEYLQKLSETTERLKEARERYAQSVRGSTSTDPALLTSEEQLRARTDDIISRALDAQYHPSAPAGAKLVTPSPFSSLPPTVVELTPPTVAPPPVAELPAYTPRQRELSDLRRQILELEKEREKVIEEMKQRNLGAVSVVE